MAGPAASYWMSDKSPEQMQEVGKQVLRYGTPAEDLYSAFSGKDFDGKEVSKGASWAFALLEVVPEAKVLGKVANPVEKIVAKGFIKGADGLFSVTKYRHNLQVFTKMVGQGMDAHHIFPKAKRFAEFFAKAGVDVNDPKNMKWLQPSLHRGKNSAEHLNAWDAVIMDRYGDKIPTVEQLQKEARKIEQKFNDK